MRHIAHGPNLIQRFTRHIENRIRQILRRFTYAREQAVLGEQAAPRRLKTRALPAIIILLQTQPREQIPVVRLLIAGVPVRPGLTEPYELFRRKHARRHHDRQPGGFLEG